MNKHPIFRILGEPILNSLNESASTTEASLNNRRGLMNARLNQDLRYNSEFDSPVSPILSPTLSPALSPALSPDPKATPELDFWDKIQTLRWHDRSEGMDITEVRRACNKFSRSDVNRFKSTYKRLFEDLMVVLNEMPPEFVKKAGSNMGKLASHIIAKGSEFYNAILSDPEFATYMIENNEYFELPLFN